MIQAKRLFVPAIMVLATLIVPVTISSAETGGISSNNAANTATNGAGGVNPHAISLYNLGLNAYKQGSPESAIIFFKRAADLDPDLADAQYNLGVLYQGERRLKEAVPRFKEALRVRPEDADSHYQLGLTLIDLNQLSDARQQLMAIAPNNSHFSDAQKKVAFIDAQIANPNADNTVITQTTTTTPATVSQPQSSTQTITVQNTNNGANAISTVSSTVADTPSTNAASSASSAATSVTTTTNTAVSPVNAVSNPVAVIDNASVQVVANGFSAPSGLTFDRQGNLYVANFATNTIDRVAADGTKTQFSSGINLKGPIGLVSDDDSNIYVANYLAGTVTRINPAGIAQIIVSGLRKPYYLTRDKEGNLFVSQQEDNTIVRIKFSQNGVAPDTVSQSTP